MYVPRGRCHIRTPQETTGDPTSQPHGGRILLGFAGRVEVQSRLSSDMASVFLAIGVLGIR